MQATNVRDNTVGGQGLGLGRLLHAMTWRHAPFILLMGIVVYLTFVPLTMILYGTFTDGPPGTDASFTLKNYMAAYGTSGLFYSALNSIMFAFFSGLISFTIGGFLAWTTERTNAPLKPVIYLLVLVPFVLPGILTSISWIFLLSPTVGLINQVLKVAFGLLEAPFNIYSFPGMSWAFGADHITLPFLLMAAAFRSMDPTLEEAASISGMGRLRSFYHVNLKLMLPSIAATILLLFIRGLETFEAPAVIGIPAGIKVFATEIFLALRRAPIDYNLAGTYATAYLVVTMLGVMLYLRVTNGAARFAMITGKGYRPRVVDLGPWRHGITAIALTVLIITVMLPLSIVIWTSLMPFYVQPSWKTLSLVTLDNYRGLFDLDEFSSALINTVLTGSVAATIAVLLSIAIAWYVIRTNVPGRKVLDAIAFTPIALPGVVLSLALVWMYLTLPIPIYGTLLILIIAFVTKFIPISLRVIHASLLQIHKELEEAAEMCGVSRLRNVFHILLPLIAPGLVVAWLYVLTLTFKDLSIPVLLSHVGTDLVSVLIFGLFQSGEFPKVCAMGVLLTFAIAIIACIARTISIRFSIKASG
jgi:iron(III) transport system permease protein